jgi:hypothetical protein
VTPRKRAIALQSAFDEARFGPRRTLNLRESLPTGAEAVRRAESWLREKQMERAGEVLVITGRGNRSAGNVSVVREEVRRMLGALKRRGVVAAVVEHTPGSFAVTLAPVRALFETIPRHGHNDPQPPTADPAALAGLPPGTRDRLRHLATLALDALGVRSPDPRFVEEEMRRQFARLSAALMATPGGVVRDPAGAGLHAGAEATPDARLAVAIARAIREYEEDAP